MIDLLTFDWFNVWLVSQSIGCLVCYVVGWLHIWSVDRLVAQSIIRLICCLVGRSADALAGCSVVGFVVNWSIGQSIYYFVGWLPTRWTEVYVWICLKRLNTLYVPYLCFILYFTWKRVVLYTYCLRLYDLFQILRSFFTNFEFIKCNTCMYLCFFSFLVPSRQFVRGRSVSAVYFFPIYSWRIISSLS